LPATTPAPAMPMITVTPTAMITAWPILSADSVVRLTTEAFS
jgi:hypothetical protein